MDRIVIDGLEVFAHHGVLPHEKRLGQRFVIDLTLEVDLERPGLTDDLDDTVDYGRLAADVEAVVKGGPHDLIETVAANVAEVALVNPLVQAVEVVVHKPHVPLSVLAREVRVEIRRERGA